MSDDKIFAIWIGLVVIGFFVVMTIKEVRTTNRQAPYGKVFVKQFLEMADDIHSALVYKHLDCIPAFVNRYKFDVKVVQEIPYEGLHYETIPVYKSFAIYVGDEIVCRIHRIKHCCKEQYFVEFSTKRNRNEVIEIVKEAHKLSKQYNHEYVTKLYSKYDSKSFYTEDDNGNK